MSDLNPESIKPWVQTLGLLFGVLKQARELLPSGSKRDQFEQLTADAERLAKEAEARMAQDLGFVVCKRCWPPEIMLCGDDNQLRCRGCGKPNPPDDAMFWVGKA